MARLAPKAKCSLLLGLGAVLLSAPAAAQIKTYPECTHEPTEGDVAAAKGAFQAGQAAFNEADYARAIDYWEDAFRRDCTAAPLLLNLARAYELNDNLRQAVVALETYVATQPDSAQKDQITRRIEVLNRQIEEAAAKEPPPPLSTELQEPVEPEEPAGTDPAASSQAPLSMEEDRAGARPIYPLFIAGGGGLLAVGGVLMWSAASSDIEAFEAVCGEDRECNMETVNIEGRMLTAEQAVEEANDARFRHDLGGALAIAGAAVAVGGVVWYFLNPRESVETAAPARGGGGRTLGVVPLISPYSQGMALTGSF